MAPQVLSIEYRPLASLRFDPQNARLHSKKQIRQIARSVQTFGFNVPVLIDGKGQLIAGHGRALAAQLLGVTDVATIRLEHLTEAQTRAFMIADNRLTENSVWDNRLLAEQLKALAVLELDFSIDVTGFEMSEIDLMIGTSHRPAAARTILPMRSRTSGQNPRSPGPVTYGFWTVTGSTAAMPETAQPIPR